MGWKLKATPREPSRACAKCASRCQIQQYLLEVERFLCFPSAKDRVAILAPFFCMSLESQGTRVCSVGKGERTYHVFFQMLQAGSATCMMASKVCRPGYGGPSLASSSFRSRRCSHGQSAHLRAHTHKTHSLLHSLLHSVTLILAHVLGLVGLFAQNSSGPGPCWRSWSWMTQVVRDRASAGYRGMQSAVWHRLPLHQSRGIRKDLKLQRAQKANQP